MERSSDVLGAFVVGGTLTVFALGLMAMTDGFGAFASARSAIEVIAVLIAAFGGMAASSILSGKWRGNRVGEWRSVGLMTPADPHIPTRIPVADGITTTIDVPAGARQIGPREEVA